MRKPTERAIFFAGNTYPTSRTERSIAMTQHVSQADTIEDQRTMRRLATVIGGFILATALLALTVGLTMG
jgi:hypothetical protein